MKESYDTIILGGGISGLVAAYNQQKKGENVLLLEASNRLGGVINTVTKEGYRLEQGPNSILTNAELAQLIQELKIEDKVRKNESIASTRYLLYNDKPVKMSPNWAFFKSGFLNFSMIWAFLAERFRKKGILEEESVADFIRRRLNGDILNRMINPLVTGVYAGDPEKLSLRSTFKKLYTMEQEHGSLVKATFKRDKNAHKREAMTFEGGLSTLIHSLGNALNSSVELGANVEKIEPTNKGFEVSYTKNEITETVTAKKVISTLPANSIGKALPFLTSTIKTNVDNIEHAPMLLLYLGYPEAQVGQEQNGFGYLIPQQENQPYLGGIWTSAIFPEVAPKGYSLFTLFVGGVNNKGVLSFPEESIIKAKEAFEKHMKITGAPSFQSHYLVERAIPQFNLGYHTLMEQLDAVEKEYPGLIISGNWRTGVAIGDCVAGNL